LFTCNSSTYANAVLIALESNQFAKALEYVAAGRDRFPDDQNLRMLQIEARAANGQCQRKQCYCRGSPFFAAI